MFYTMSWRYKKHHFIGLILCILFVCLDAQISRQRLYLGCYRDVSDNRDLNGWSDHNVQNLTPDWCINECQRKGSFYAGVQYGIQCFCGNSYGKHGPAGKDDCNMTCSGDNQTICGESARNSVYQTHLKGFYKGCFKLNSLTSMDGITDMTPPKCVTKCVKDTANHTAALKKGDECYCIGRDQLISSNYATHCDIPCEGNTGVMCGGENSYSVYDWNIESQQLGCYTDGLGANSKPLPDDRIDENKSATWDMCINHCSINGSLYSGSQFGLACFCGTDYDKVGVTTGCDMSCPGNKTQTCGAGNKNTVHRTYTECQAGKYGFYKCNETCAINCDSGGGYTCDGATGVCVKGCKPGLKEESIDDLRFCNRACDNGTFGKGCIDECHCLGNLPCDKINGSCTNGCAAGFQGLNCSTSCDKDKFGVNCAGSCNCHGGLSCNATNGFCENGCAAGFKATNCTTKCDGNEFGISCLGTCHCFEDEACNATNGFCENGCSAGFKGSNCSTGCDDKEFGINCVGSCNCHEGLTCNATNGFCENGCAAGFKGSNCTTGCQDQEFGINCLGSCNCNEGTSCNATNGFCENGCAAGFKGTNCTMDCDDNEFGINCIENCNCFDGEACNATNGFCENGCTAGFKGSNCSTGCDDQEFGINCLGSCNCHEELSCNVTNGFCENGCAAGFKGSNCTLDCDNSEFGISCLGTCHCFEDEACNVTNGFCENGCSAGFKGSNCSTGCDDQEFGLNCVGSCNCNEGLSCNSTNGFCENGCVAGFKDANCSTKCDDQEFGINCFGSCNCHEEASCNATNGFCENGCAAGFKDTNCSLECDDQEFGINCLEPCNCHEGKPCNSTNGFCENGCAAGFKDTNCSSECNDQEFGISCLGSCNCYEGRSCNSTNGFCENGCAAGFKDTNCSMGCSDQEFGVDCLESCNCHEEKSCNATNGFCKNGCAAGFKDTNCSIVCSDKEFGINCLGSCNCDEGKSCNSTDGFCENGCAAGFKSTNCSAKCDSDTFGLRCSKTCHCANAGQCNHVMGSCTDGWCDKGWSGLDCQKDCGNSSFGFNCNISCNCMDSCDRFNGSCSGQCIAGWVGEDCQRKVGARDPDNTGRDVGISMGVILMIIIIVIIIIFILRKRGTQFPKRNKMSRSEETAFSNKMSEEEDPNEDGNIYSNITTEPKEDSFIQLKNLADHLRILMSGTNFKTEYAKFLHGPQEPTEVARRPQNKPKNRYVDLYPYEKNRVKLSSVPGVSESEYINASLIQGFKVDRQYIAAQAPNRITVNDFIRMLWEKDLPRIVMTTNLTENGRHKCFKYWPDEGEESFDSITVALISEEELEDYTIRSFELSKEGEKGKKKCIHYHFTSWPDHGVPKSGTSLIQFRNKVRQNTEPGLTLVHCSAGVGRTGTYIALDCLLDQADSEAGVEIKGCVTFLRDQRVNMVQTVEQYVFIHETILQQVSCGNPLIPVTQFIKKMMVLDEIDPKMEKSRLVLQYEALTLCQVIFDAESLEPAKSGINKAKNRNQEILASNPVRPYLMTQVDDRSNYINAVYLKGYSKRDAYIITQMPLPDTVVDLWRLVYDYKISTIVMIDDNQDDKTCGIYWPQKSTIDIGPFAIALQSENENSTITIRSFKVKFGGKERSVQQYCIPGWTTNKPDAEDYMAVFKVIQLVQSEAKEGIPVLIHCLNGTDKSGFYCVMSNLLEQIQHEQKVNIYQTVKFLMESRPEIMTTLEQYKGYHEAVKVYVEKFMTYANVL